MSRSWLILNLFHDDISAARVTIYIIEWKENIIVIGQQLNVWKETVDLYFKVLSRYSPGDSRENCD